MGYCTYVGDNLLTWHSRKQKVVSCSSAEVEDQYMTTTTHKII